MSGINELYESVKVSLKNELELKDTINKKLNVLESDLSNASNELLIFKDKCKNYETEIKSLRIEYEVAFLFF